MLKWTDLLLLWLLSLATSFLFLAEPGFGDELTYWGVAFGLHDGVRGAWGVRSFHDLRWPVWGVSWLWQTVVGGGLPSFYCAPFFYLAAASTAVFVAASKFLNSRRVAWAAAILLMFAPVLDAVVSRPMPDLSEGFFGAVALLAWWAAMTRERGWARWGILSGVCIGMAFSNRVTGIFIAPVLTVGTVAFFPRSLWLRLAVPALSAAAFFGLEGLVYHQACGDWLHSLHANLGARGAKDVEVTTLWHLPMRMIPGFFKGNRLAPIYAVLTIVGLWAGWTRFGKGGRILVTWFVVLYFEYSCAIQSLHPVRPLIGSTFRYLGTLALPMSVVAAIGAITLANLLAAIRWPRLQIFTRAAAQRPVTIGCVAVAALALYTTRSTFDPGFTVPMMHYMETLPAGTRVLTHRSMRDLGYMINDRAARRIEWLVPGEMMERNDEAEQAITKADQFWYLVKQLWLRTRKKIEDGKVHQQPALASYLETPERDWSLAQALTKNGGPELVFYQRRKAESPAPQILPAGDLTSEVLPIPASWQGEQDARNFTRRWQVPPQMRGQIVRWELAGASTSPEPCDIKLTFEPGSRSRDSLMLKPIFYSAGGKQSFTLPIPADAAECVTEFRFHKNTRDLTITSGRVIFEAAR